jgi:phospholipase/carboxylesterase
VALGFSNGANIAAALLMLHPDALAGAVLLRAMVPFSVSPGTDLAGKDVLILSGSMDPIAPPENAARLEAMLSGSGASISHRSVPASHGLSQADIALTQDWLRSR